MNGNISVSVSTTNTIHMHMLAISTEQKDYSNSVKFLNMFHTLFFVLIFFSIKLKNSNFELSSSLKTQLFHFTAEHEQV